MDNNYIKTGAVVLSLKGHDSGKLYLIVKVLSNDFVLVADGDNRSIANPKTKRIKHVRPQPPLNDKEHQKIEEEAISGKITDISIRKYLKKIYERRQVSG